MLNWLLIQLGLRVRWRLTKGGSGNEAFMWITVNRGSADSVYRIIDELLDHGWWIDRGPIIGVVPHEQRPGDRREGRRGRGRG